MDGALSLGMPLALLLVYNPALHALCLDSYTNSVYILIHRDTSPMHIITASTP